MMHLLLTVALLGDLMIHDALIAWTSREHYTPPPLFRSTTTPLRHYTPPPLLRYHTIPPHHSTTPLYHDSATTRFTTTSLCYYATTPYVTSPQPYSNITPILIFWSGIRSLLNFTLYAPSFNLLAFLLHHLYLLLVTIHIHSHTIHIASCCNLSKAC